MNYQTGTNFVVELFTAIIEVHKVTKRIQVSLIKTGLYRQYYTVSERRGYFSLINSQEK